MSLCYFVLPCALSPKVRLKLCTPLNAMLTLETLSSSCYLGSNSTAWVTKWWNWSSGFTWSPLGLFMIWCCPSIHSARGYPWDISTSCWVGSGWFLLFSTGDNGETSVVYVVRTGTSGCITMSMFTFAFPCFYLSPWSDCPTCAFGESAASYCMGASIWVVLKKFICVFWFNLALRDDKRRLLVRGLDPLACLRGFLLKKLRLACWSFSCSLTSSRKFLGLLICSPPVPSCVKGPFLETGDN